MTFYLYVDYEWLVIFIFYNFFYETIFRILVDKFENFIFQKFGDKYFEL